MNITKVVIANTSSQVLSRLVSSAIGFLITILVARHFGLGGYADLAKITALVSLFYLGIDLGANAIFLQLEKQEQKFHQLLFFRLFLAGCMFFAIFLLTLFLPYDSITTAGYSLFVKIGIILFSLSFFTRAIVYSTGAVFQQNLVYQNATKAAVLGSVATLLLVGLTVFLSFPLLWIIAAYVLGGFLEALISLYLVKQDIKFSLPSLAFSKKLFFLTLPLTILLFLNLLYFRLDMVLLTLFQKTQAVGIYDYAYKYFDFLIALPLFLSNSLYPHLLKQENNSRIQKKNIGLYTLLFFCLGLLLIPIVWTVAPLVVLVKKDFLPSVLPLRLLGFSLPVFFATSILQWIFITKKKQTFLVFLYAASLLLNVFLNILFIPSYSYVASAVITGFSELLILLIMCFYLFVKNV